MLEGLAEVLICKVCRTSATGSSAEEAYLKKERFVNVLKGYCLLTNGCGKGFKPNRTSVIEFYDGLHHFSVGVVKTQRVNLKSA